MREAAAEEDDEDDEEDFSLDEFCWRLRLFLCINWLLCCLEDVRSVDPVRSRRLCVVVVVVEEEEEEEEEKEEEEE